MRIVGVVALVLLLAVPGNTVMAQQVRVIAPAMTEGQVRESWGEPLIVRQRGEFTYMFYENGCLKTCGMHGRAGDRRGRPRELPCIRWSVILSP